LGFYYARAMSFSSKCFEKIATDQSMASILGLEPLNIYIYRV